MIAIIDYDVGNLFSLCAVLDKLRCDYKITKTSADLAAADRIILPGVGAFGDAIDHFRASGLNAELDEQVRRGKPLLGICVGMQLLFETGMEFGTHAGLGYLSGIVAPLRGLIPATLKIPHMGWNKLRLSAPEDPLLSRMPASAYGYFVHSFYACCDKSYVLATAEYGADIPAIVRHKNVCGAQFHPELSADTGIGLLEAFLAM